jgi:hypothetical protein
LLKASLSDTNEVLHIGDTLTVRLKLPQVAETPMGAVGIQSIKKSSVVIFVLQVDTINKTSSVVFHRNNTAPIVSTLMKGEFTTSVDNAIYFTLSSPYEIEVKFVMKQKGVYYFDVPYQPAILYYNNDRRANTYINFDVVNKHHVLLGSYFGNPFLLSVAEKERLGFGTYGFRVE